MYADINIIFPLKEIIVIPNYEYIDDNNIFKKVIQPFMYADVSIIFPLKEIIVIPNSEYIYDNNKSKVSLQEIIIQM